MTITNSYILALDVGEKRIGVALASPIARLAQPLKVLQNSENIWDELKALISKEAVGVVVVGLPRSLSGKDTSQTISAREFAAKLAKLKDIKIVLQDEALTSRQAEAELRARGDKYEKGDIDALAATYILEDYLASIRTMEQPS